MRPRSKSMYIERSNVVKNDEYNVDEQKKDIWTSEEDMRLIRQMWEQIKKNDVLPYDEQLKNINWKKIFILGQKSTDIKQRFDKILENIRKYRLLTEILKDIEKQILQKIDLPKKPSTPFGLFVEDNKDKLKKLGGNSIKSYTVSASKLFKELPENEKEAYIQRSSDIKNTYNDMISRYNLENKLNKGNAEKKITPLSLFWNDMKQRDPDANYNAVRKMYSDLDGKNKLELILRLLGVEQDEKLNLQQYLYAQRVLSKEEMGILDKYEGRPKLMNGYAIFVKEFINSQKKKVRTNEVFHKSKEMWGTLSLEQKQSYKNQSLRLRNEYIRFLNSLPDDRKEFELQSSSKFKKNKIIEKEKHNDLNLNIPNNTDENSRIYNPQEHNESLINSANDQEEYEFHSSKHKNNKTIEKEKHNDSNLNIPNNTDENSRICNPLKNYESFINSANDQEEYEFHSSKHKNNKTIKKEKHDDSNLNIPNNTDENSRIYNPHKHNESLINSANDQEEYELQSSSKNKNKRNKKEKHDDSNLNIPNNTDENSRIYNPHKHNESLINSANDQEEYELQSSSKNKNKRNKKEKHDDSNLNIPNNTDENSRIYNPHKHNESLINSANDQEEYELQSSSKNKNKKRNKKEKHDDSNLNIPNNTNENSRIYNPHKHNESLINSANDQEEYELQSSSKNKNKKRNKKEKHDDSNLNIPNNTDENSRIYNPHKHNESLINSANDQEEYELQSSSKNKNKRNKKEKHDDSNLNIPNNTDENSRIYNHHKHNEIFINSANDQEEYELQSPSKHKKNERLEFEGFVQPEVEKKKKASKRKLSEESSIEVNNFPRPKIIDNNKSELSEDAVRQHKKPRYKSEKFDEESSIVLGKLVRPPSTTYKYYVLYIYKGPRDKAKASYKSLTESEKKSIEKKRKKKYDKFLKDVKQHSRLLETEDSKKLLHKMILEEQDDITDLTSTDSE